MVRRGFFCGLVACLWASWPFHAAAAGLELRVDTHDEEALRPVLERELATMHPPPDGALTVRDEGAMVRVTFRARDGRVLERAIEVHAEGPERQEVIALLATHLARDEAAAFLLPPPAPPPSVAAPEQVQSALRVNVDAWVAPESGLGLAAFAIGGSHWQALIAGGGKVSLGTARGVDPVLAVGGGAHLELTPRLFVDVDGLAHLLHRFDDDDHLAGLAQLRAVLGIRLGSQVAVWGGPTVNALFVEENELHRAPGFAAQLAAEEPNVQLWPGLVLGVRYELKGRRP